MFRPRLWIYLGLSVLSLGGYLVWRSPVALADGYVRPAPVVQAPALLQPLVAPPAYVRPPEPFEGICTLDDTYPDGPVNHQWLIRGMEQFTQQFFIPQFAAALSRFYNKPISIEEGSQLLRAQVVKETLAGQVFYHLYLSASQRLYDTTRLNIMRANPMGTHPTFVPVVLVITPLGERLRRGNLEPADMRMCDFMLTLPQYNVSNQIVFMEGGVTRPPVYATGINFTSQRFTVYRNTTPGGGVGTVNNGMLNSLGGQPGAFYQR